MICVKCEWVIRSERVPGLLVGPLVGDCLEAQAASLLVSLARAGAVRLTSCSERHGGVRMAKRRDETL